MVILPAVGDSVVSLQKKWAKKGLGEAIRS